MTEPLFFLLRRDVKLVAHVSVSERGSLPDDELESCKRNLNMH